MKRITIVLLCVFLMISMYSCTEAGAGAGDIGADDGTTDDTSPTAIALIPTVGFNSPAASRSSVTLSGDVDQSNYVQYLIMSPLLTNFNSVSGYTEDSTYSIAVLDSFMDFEIVVNEDSTITYTGKMRDDSGSLVVDYNPTSGKFSFEQILFIQVTTTSAMDVAIYVEGTDLSISDTGNFQGLYDFSFIRMNSDDSWLFGTFTAELYRGIMNSSNKLGTGFIYCSDDDTDGSDGYRYVYGGSADSNLSDYNSSMTIPTEVSVSTLSLWKTYLSSDNIQGLDVSNSSFNNKWQMGYKLDDSTSVVWVDGGDTTTYFFSDDITDDLSTWKSNSFYK